MCLTRAAPPFTICCNLPPDYTSFGCNRGFKICRVCNEYISSYICSVWAWASSNVNRKHPTKCSFIEIITLANLIHKKYQQILRWQIPSNDNPIDIVHWCRFFQCQGHNVHGFVSDVKTSGERPSWQNISMNYNALALLGPSVRRPS